MVVFVCCCIVYVLLQVDCSSDFPISEATRLAESSLGLRPKQIAPIYQYWIRKRKKINNALMRMFQVRMSITRPFVVY